MKIVLASKNRHKLEEIAQILTPYGIELVLQSELCPTLEVEETGSTFEENSFLKADAVMRATGLPALADDSGLSVDALDGEPGIYSARYGDDPGLDDKGRYELLLRNMEHIPDGERTARFVCVITLVYPNGKSLQVRGEAVGEILRGPIGNSPFGYDPIFYYPPMEKSFGEMEHYEKNAVSHRANALKLFCEKLNEEKENADK